MCPSRFARPVRGVDSVSGRAHTGPSMGYAARRNPRARDGGKNERAVLNARLFRFGQFFMNRAHYEDYLAHHGVTDPDQRLYLEQFLPPDLQDPAKVAMLTEKQGYFGVRVPDVRP